jgi:hypothetical protein
VGEVHAQTDWIFIGRSQHDSLFICRRKILPSGHVRVWERYAALNPYEVNAKGKASTLIETLILVEFDCDEERVKELSTVGTYLDGHTETNGEETWRYVYPRQDAAERRLMEAACNPPKSKKHLKKSTK